MTEIPEHLLKRSAARRGKSTGGGDGGGDAAASGSAVEKAESSGPVQPKAIQQAAAAIPRDPEPEPERTEPAFVRAAKERKKMPMWAMAIPGLALLWAYSFAGTMQQPDVEDPLFIDSAELYGSAGCSGCHGGGGGGGIGYQLSDGEILATFPEPIDQMVHIARGSAAISGQPYGDPERAGGQRVAGNRGVMPAYESSLSLNELELIVFHERHTLSGEDDTAPEYQEWMDHMREVAEGVIADGPIDLEFLLSCANPEYTPGATADAEDPEECPGPPPAEDEGSDSEEASG